MRLGLAPLDRLLVRPSNSHQDHAFLHVRGAGRPLAGAAPFFAMITISKVFEARQSAESASDADLETIKKFALRDLSAEDLWLGKMALANDQVDRSGERFPVTYLERFAATLPGKPVLIGHRHDSQPVGKFYDADVVPRADGGGNDLIARYYLRAGNPLAADIELGIASGVSIGARADRRFCGICAKDYDRPGKDRCAHQVGESYDGKTCFLEWGGDASKVEALEGSFVASPCQLGAQALARGYDGSVLTKGTSFDAADPAPQGDDMELKEALEKIASLETENAALKKAAAESEPLVKAGQEYLDLLKEEALTKSGAVSEADRAQTEAFLKSIETPNLILLKTIHQAAKSRFDEKFPPAPLGVTKDDNKEPKPAFDPVGASPFARSA